MFILPALYDKVVNRVEWAKRTKMDGNLQHVENVTRAFFPRGRSARDLVFEFRARAHRQELHDDSTGEGTAAPAETETPQAMERITLVMNALCVNNRSRRQTAAQDRTRRRISRIARQERVQDRQRDLALARLVAVLENAHAEEMPHLTGRFRIGDDYSRLARLRAAHATYALATLTNMKRASDGAFVRS